MSAYDVTVKLRIAPEGRDRDHIDRAVGEACSREVAGKAVPDFGSSPAIVRAVGSGDEAVEVVFDVRVQDESELETRILSTVEEMRREGLVVLGNAVIVSQNPVRPKTARAPGVSYDQATRTLTVDTWAPDWGDLALSPMGQQADGTGVMVVSDRGGHRIEEAFVVRQVLIKRWKGGQPGT